MAEPEVINLAHHRRRPPPWRAIIAATVATLVLVGIWLVWFSPILSVRTVSVSGAMGNQAQQIVVAASVPLGEPIARTDTTAIAARVRARLAWVSASEVRRGYPNSIVIAVTVRTPVARTADGRAVSADGLVYSPPGPLPSGLLAVSGADVPSTGAAASVVSQLPPALSAKVASADARTPNAVTLTLKNGAVVRWGSASQSQLKAQVLGALLPRRARLFDVSAPQAPSTFGEHPLKHRARPPAVASPPIPGTSIPSSGALGN